MKIEGKKKDFLDKKCKKAFGVDFDTMYHLVEKIIEDNHQSKQLKEKK